MFLEVPQDSIGLMFTKREVKAFISLMHIVERVVLYTKEK